MLEISPVHTACKQCVFAVYDGNTQTDCAIDYLSKYRKDSEILDVYDDEKEFYVINNKKCLCYRENKWFNKYNMSMASLEEKINLVLKTNTISYTLLIDLKQFEENDTINIAHQIDSMKYKPKKIIFIRYHKDQKSYHTYDYLKNILDQIQSQGLSWRLQTMVNDDSYYEILNNTVNLNKKTRFICSVKTPSDDLNKIIEFANNLVYNELKTFIVVSNSSKTITLFSGGIYRYSAVVNKTNILANPDNYIIV